MKRSIEGEDRTQSTLFPASLDEYVDEDNPVRVIDAFVDALDLEELGFKGVVPEATGRPSYHPTVLLKIYVYGFLNRIASSRRLEKETQRNIEMIWLTGRLMPDFKTIANFRKENSEALRGVTSVVRRGRPRILDRARNWPRRQEFPSGRLVTAPFLPEALRQGSAKTDR